MIKSYKEEEKYRLTNLRFLWDKITSTFSEWGGIEEENYIGQILEEDGEVFKHGIGLSIHENAEGKKSFHLGEYDKNVKWGIGMWVFGSGEVEEGEYDTKLIKGLTNFASSGRYFGTTHNETGNFYGFARYAFPNGDFYLGEYALNKRNGKGTFIDANGNRSEGVWKEGKKHGNFILTDQNGHFFE